ncbi:hypothetical protein HDU67_008008 [Dinochytrium kinnereticum]|nr:hypothetical protein HDU67_008008 [Dinochytrium kinnereticum]
MTRSEGALCALMVVISHLALHRRRRFQGSLIAANNIGVFMLAGSTFLTIPDMNNLLCASQYEEATFTNNNLCYAQGSIFILGASLAVIYASINLHLSVVWRNKVMEKFPVTVHVISCMAAFAMSFPIIYTKSGTTMPTFYCTVQPEKANAWYFAPQSVLLGVSVILHICTAGFIYSVSRGTADDAKKWVRQQVRMQWRSMLLTFVFLFTWLQFFLIFEIALPKVIGVNSSTPWVVEWVKCVIKNAPNGQEICSKVAGPNVLDVRIVSPFLVLGGLVGFFNVLIFMTQGSLFREWHELITGIPMDETSSFDGQSSHGQSAHGGRSQTGSSNRVSIGPSKVESAKKEVNRGRSDSAVSNISKPASVRTRSDSESTALNVQTRDGGFEMHRLPQSPALLCPASDSPEEPPQQFPGSHYHQLAPTYQRYGQY